MKPSMKPEVPSFVIKLVTHDLGADAATLSCSGVARSLLLNRKYVSGVTMAFTYSGI